MKTSELTGAALDWAVAKCHFVKGTAASLVKSEVRPYSTDWAEAGPIIKWERISVWARGNEWAAESFIPNQQGHEETGPTPLIAAMRCYVASKLGDDVEIPEELREKK